MRKAVMFGRLRTIASPPEASGAIEAEPYRSGISRGPVRSALISDRAARRPKIEHPRLPADSL